MKIMALVIAGVMTFGAASVASAYTIKIDTSENKATHTYNVYQLFTGDVGADGKTLSNVKWGNAYENDAEKWNDGQALYVDGSVLDEIKTQNDARAYAQALGTSNLKVYGTLDGTTTQLTDAPGGWYMIVDTNYSYEDGRAVDDTDAYSAYIVQVVNDVNMKPKSAAPEVDKEVSDDEAGDTWKEAADHEIGESFQFKLTATLSADTDYAAYATYKIQFNDTMSAGVTFESIESVKIGSTVIPVQSETTPDGYVSTATAGQKGGPWTLTIADIKKFQADLTSGAVVEVIYNAHLNEAAKAYNADATADSETANNKVSLTYSNNPDASGNGKPSEDTTPEDYVWVFTYKVENTKVDGNGDAMEDVGFTLYPADAKTSDEDPSVGAISLYKVGDVYYVGYTADKAADYPENGEVVTEMKSSATGTFNIKGLDVGSYVLKETDVPAGYVKAEDTEIVIAATESENGNLTSADLKLSEDAKNLSNRITNYTGSTLPSTGGIGTTIFYVIGAILVLGAGIILVSKKRMSVN